MGETPGENFEALLDAAVALLRRRGRVTLRGLGRHLDVDEGCVADICDELVLALRVADTEEGGKVLVLREGSPRSSAVPAGPSSSSGERRQLTVMFCDMVGSTSLSGRMDPEDFGALLRAYQERCAAAIAPFEGHIAQYLGDGILVYFGYPRAHEDDAVRGVMAGLAILDAITHLNREHAARDAPEVGVRIGIHTGLVVVDEVGAGPSREHLAVGEVPNVAARLQSLGETNSVVISDATRRLVEGRFTASSRGTHDLTKSGERWEVFTVTGRVERDQGLAHRVAMVGREAELTQLEDRLARSLAGEGQVIFLRGEAGIGKSRVVSELRRRAEARGCDIHVYYASPHFTQTPLYPVSERLRRGLELDTASDPIARIREFLALTGLDSDESVALVATFLNVDGAPEAQTKNLIGDMQALVVEWLVRNAQRQPTLPVWEDLHWVDPSTLELLGTLLERCRRARVLIGATFRESFQPPWDVGEPPPTTIALGKLPRRDLERLVHSVAGGADLSEGMLDEVLTKTDGIPLFAEELAKSLVEVGVRKSTIPSTLQDLRMARLDGLGRAKEIAQL
ncbi:MAG: adenylate/guanylate cyclase domain-containing protein, partial [Polyangiaceae bacterium]